MNIFNKPPVFCDNCSKFALAMLDGAPLCESCLVTTVGKAEEPNYHKNIKPFCFQASACPTEISASQELLLKSRLA